jgi:hypothetical protein
LYRNIETASYPAPVNGGRDNLRNQRFDKVIIFSLKLKIGLNDVRENGLIAGTKQMKTASCSLAGEGDAVEFPI